MSQDHKIPPRESFSNREKELDDFWDVGRLLSGQNSKPKYAPTTPRKIPEAVSIDVPPPKKTTPSAPIRTITVPPTGSVPLSFSHGEKAVMTDERKISSQASSVSVDTPLLTYTPEGCLINQVKIYEWQSNYQYFDQFTKDAVAYSCLTGKEVSHKSFFSYFPQYAQLNRQQRAWYLYWRDQVRKEVYLKTDYSYILLYLFELINLPADSDTAECHRDLMAKIWVAYRKEYPQLDHYACEWLCDYCLIHQLPAPVLHLMPVLGHIITNAGLKEFYLSSMITVGDDQVNLASAQILLTHCCQYDYRKSKFYSEEHKALFDDLIPRTVSVVFPMLMKNGGRNSASAGESVMMPDAQVSRDAYVSALCAYSNKRRIKVSYISFSRSHDLRFMLGDMVKHIENRIRAAILVRSRLTVHYLAPALRKTVDNYLDRYLPSPEVAAKKAVQHQPRPAYEAFYDLPHTAVSITSADTIEQDSWETTKILVEAFAEDDVAIETTEAQSMVKPMSKVVSEPAKTEISTETVSETVHPLLEALGDRVEFLRAVLFHDRAGEKTYCSSHKMLPDAVIDEINNLSVEHEIYDMILETDEQGNCCVIEDYRDTVKELLQI